MPRGAWSRPMKTVEPLAVRPETASKTASVNDIGRCISMNGRAPQSEAATQAMTAARAASRVPRRWKLPWLASTSARPTKRVMTEERAKLRHSGLPSARSKPAGASMASPRALSTVPTKLSTASSCTTARRLGPSRSGERLSVAARRCGRSIMAGA